MSPKILLIITAFMSLGVAVFALFFPEQMMATQAGKGVKLTDQGLWILRSMGMNFVGYAAIAWFARNSSASPARQAILLGFAVAFAVNGLFLAYMIIMGKAIAAAWGSVVFNALFAGAYVFTFTKKTE